MTLDTAKERISKLEDRSVEITLTETQRKNGGEKKKVTKYPRAVGQQKTG